MLLDFPADLPGNFVHSDWIRSCVSSHDECQRRRWGWGVGGGAVGVGACVVNGHRQHVINEAMQASDGARAVITTWRRGGGGV